MNDVCAKKERESWVDSVRVFAAFLVICVHASGVWLGRYGKVSNDEWLFAHVIDSVARNGVPLFFMLSGYLLLAKPVSLRTFFERRMAHVVVPWVVWSAIYGVWNLCYLHASGGVQQMLFAFLTGKVSFHLWFLYALVGLYLFVPVLSWVLCSAGERPLLYYLVVWFVASSLLPLANSALFGSASGGEMIAFDLRPFAGYSGYLVLGYILGRLHLNRRVLLVAAGFFVFGVLTTIFATIWVTTRRHAFSDAFYGYLTPNVVIGSSGALVLLRWLGVRLGEWAAWRRIAVRVSAASFGIYLVHPIFLSLVRDGVFSTGLTVQANRTAYSVPWIILLVFLLSYATTHLFKSVPLAKRTV